MKNTIRIGTRGSALALYQAELVSAHIKKNVPQVEVEIIRIKTSGDMVRRGVHNPLETKRIFTREIEESLLAEEVDVAVHSAKDMAAVLPQGLQITAALEREDARDCFISKTFKKFSELPQGARIGTSSLRRKAQLLRVNPELSIEELRGNVDTRIKKCEEGHYDGIILALAGVKRLGLTSHVAEPLDETLFYPAPGQGVIVVQTREADEGTNEIIRLLNHDDTEKRLKCERAFLKRLEGGCQLPCGIITELSGGKIIAKGSLLSPEERKWADGELEGDASQSEALGVELAEKILENGGAEILESIRKHFDQDHEKSKK